MTTGTHVPPRGRPITTMLPGFAHNAPKRNVLVLLTYVFAVMLVAALFF